MSYESNSTEAPLRLKVEELSARPRKTVQPILADLSMAGNSLSQAPSPPTAPIPVSSTLDGVLTAFKALGFALSARAMLLVSLVGLFVIAVMAMLAQTAFALAVCLLYGIFAILPVAWLELHKRPPT